MSFVFVFGWYGTRAYELPLNTSITVSSSAGSSSWVVNAAILHCKVVTEFLSWFTKGCRGEFCDIHYVPMYASHVVCRADGRSSVQCRQWWALAHCIDPRLLLLVCIRHNERAWHTVCIVHDKSIQNTIHVEFVALLEYDCVFSRLKNTSSLWWYWHTHMMKGIVPIFMGCF